MVLTTGAVPLICHPRTPFEAVYAVEVVAAVSRGGHLVLTYVLQGDPFALQIPDPGPSRWAENLWRHTCFEAFVMADAGPAYREFNFSPSGEWAMYGFRGYREGRRPMDEPAPKITVRHSEDRLSLDAALRPECLPRGRLLRLGLSAVVEGIDGALSYWALRHSAGRPDFHHPDAFALSLVLSVMPGAADRAVGKTV